MGKEYVGTVSKTVNGHTCQRWDSQSPHKHSMAASRFPENSLTAAANFCRYKIPTGILQVIVKTNSLYLNKYIII